MRITVTCDLAHILLACTADILSRRLAGSHENQKPNEGEPRAATVSDSCAHFRCPPDCTRRPDLCVPARGHYVHGMSRLPYPKAKTLVIGELNLGPLLAGPGGRPAEKTRISKPE